jgi:hypothetical protein
MLTFNVSMSDPNCDYSIHFVTDAYDFNHRMRVNLDLDV